MFDRPTRLFLRWRDRGDPVALGELFDRLAPELLRLAVHLARDIVDAEDLVQSTFLAAIESAPRFERSKRVAPWLAGILVHRAHAERRRRQRAPTTGADGDVVPAPADGPDRDAERAEMSASARAALDSLREPFRQPTVLRLVHGMETADIALLLNRSPGTVRAQIHRGIVRVRRTLPGALGVLAVGAGTAGRGLAAIRLTVVTAGAKVGGTAAAASAVATSAIATGVLMGKKGLAVVSALLAIGLGSAMWWLSADRPVSPSSVADATEGASGVVAAPGNARAPGSTADRDPGTQRSALETTATTSTWMLRAKVVDGPTKEPLAGAIVESFGPRSMTLLGLQRELASVSRPGATGIPFTHAGSCALPKDAPIEVRHQDAAYPFLVPPDPNAVPLASVRSGVDGTFEVAMPSSGAVLAVTAAGHGVRHVAYSGAPQQEPVIELWPSVRFSGRVRTADDETPPTPIELSLWSDKGTWNAKTDAAGSFSIEAAADFLMVECRTPGWTVTRERTLADGRRWVVNCTVRPGLDETIWLERFGSARLHVTDAETGEPIDTISLRTLDQFGAPRHCSRFATQDGWLSLDLFGAEQYLSSSAAMRTSMPTNLSLTVWADGHLPLHVANVALYADQPTVVEARLARGALPTLTGTVVRRGDAVRALVQLRPYSRFNWQHDTSLTLALATTDGSGAFRLTAPEGDYVCEVLVAGRCEAQFALALPHQSSLTIDLADAVYVDVAVVDAKGQPQAEHNVAVNGERHQQRQARTAGDGRATLGPFAPGRLQVAAPLTATAWSWTNGVTQTVEAAPGSRPSVTLRLPDTTPIRVSLAFVGEPPPGGFTGFVARDERVGAPATEAAVEGNGMVPLDVLPGGSRLLVEAPDRRRWELDIPMGTPPGTVLSLTWHGLAYAGVVWREDGEPFANCRVTATPVGDRRTRATRSVDTDDGGAFCLDGLDPTEYVLAFAAVPRSRGGTDPTYSKVRFRPSGPPELSPAPLQIRLAAFRDGRYVGRGESIVSGQVLDAAGHAIGGASVSISALASQGGGDLELLPSAGWQTCDDAGTFRIRVPRGAKHRVWIESPQRDRRLIETITLPDDAEIQRDLVLR